MKPAMLTVDLTNSILLTYRSKLLVSGSNKRRSQSARQFTATILKNVESLGFSFSNDLVDELLHCSESELSSFYDTTISMLKTAVGAHRKHEPMYPNFPRQVMEASDAELYLNAIMHYFGDWVGARITPEYKKERRSPLIEATEIRVLSLGTIADLHEVMKNLMESKSSISASDTENIKWYIKKYSSEAFSGPLNVTHKEVMAVVVRACLDNKVDAKVYAKMAKSIGDVIRIASSLSDGDVSLAVSTKFNKFSRSQRKVLLTMANGLERNDDDINKYRGQMIRLGEIIHPGEYKTKLPNAFALFSLARNTKLETTVGKIETAIAKDDIKKAIKLLADKPGQFARRLDHLLRKDKSQDLIIAQFAEVAVSVSPTVLLQAYSHFKNRAGKADRLAFPKGQVAKAICIGAPVGIIDKRHTNKIMAIIEDALIKQFSTRPALGKVFIDEKLKNYLVPFSQRSASKALKTIVRGSKVSLAEKEGNILRCFVWWLQPEGVRTDLDISGGFYGPKWEHVADVGYYNLREGFSTHSGDFTSAPNGAAEYIDIDMKKAREQGVRYAYITVRSYTQQPFCDLPECFAGFMHRDKPQAGQVFDARTIKNKFDISSNSNTCLPFVVDLETQEMIWADLANPNIGVYNNNRSDAVSTVKVLQNLISMDRFNLYDLFMLHVKARGDITLNRDTADLVLSVDNETPFQTDKIVSEYL